MDNKSRTWAQISLDAIRNNINCIKSVIKPGTKIMAVVKADAYGHGMVEVSKLCMAEKIDFLSVATLDEAIQLREHGVTIPILILGSTGMENFEEAVMNDIRVTVYQNANIDKLSAAAHKLGKKAQIHIKLDTGMSRIGFAPNEESLLAIRSIADQPGINIEGIFTHFAQADQDSDFTLEQLNIFKDFIKRLGKLGISIELKHCANSAAIFRYPETHLDMVRAGVVMYGLYPSPCMKEFDPGIIPAMTLKSRVSMVKTLASGQGVSYGRTYVCDRETRVATVPIGYADGYKRAFSNHSWAMIKGQKAHSIGTVCMDQCMFDITGIDGVQEGDEVILFGKKTDGITADDLAAVANTINYEIVCSVSSRVPRTYV